MHVFVNLLKFHVPKLDDEALQSYTRPGFGTTAVYLLSWRLQPYFLSCQIPENYKYSSCTKDNFSFGLLRPVLSGQSTSKGHNLLLCTCSLLSLM